MGAILGELNVRVCDADGLAHAAMQEGTTCYAKVVDAFGREIVDPDGAISRQRLGARVFGDDMALALLNALVHPYVNAAWRAWLTEVAESVSAAAILVPLLFEAGYQAGWDGIWCVTCNPDVQWRRLMERGLDPGAARRRIDVQWPLARKVALSDCVLVNNASLDLLKEQVRIALRYVMEKQT